MTQTADADELALGLLKLPKFNLLSCNYVRPCHSTDNNLKIEKDEPIPIDPLKRGIVGFESFEIYLQTSVSMISGFLNYLTTALVKCIHVYLDFVL